jgi:hypothetical protein
MMQVDRSKGSSSQSQEFFKRCKILLRHVWARIKSHHYTDKVQKKICYCYVLHLEYFSCSTQQPFFDALSDYL